MDKNTGKTGGDPIMNVPKTILYKTLKNAISGGEDESIMELADLLHGGMQYHLVHDSRITDNSIRIEAQHHEIMNTVEAMREGFRQMEKRFEQIDRRFEQVDKRFEQVDKRFEQMDKRFDDLIHQFDRRFDQVDKRFAFQSWLIGIGFVSINTLVVLLKIFG